MHLALRQAYQRARNATADITTKHELRAAPADAIETKERPTARFVRVPIPIQFTEEQRIAQWIERQKQLSPQLRDWNDDRSGPSVCLIQKVVCQHFGINRLDMLSVRRTKDIVMPRHIAMYLSKAGTERSLPYIGGKFGGRDHTTVLHAIKKIEAMIGKDAVFAEQIEALKKAISEA